MTIDLSRPEHEKVAEHIRDIAVAYLSTNPVRVENLASVIGTIKAAYISTLAAELPREIVEPPKPAIDIKHSVTPNYLICLECGAKHKTLKRHLRAAHGLSPEEYREKWGLADDYPMSAPNYTERRSEVAKKMGLGQKKGDDDT